MITDKWVSRHHWWNDTDNEDRITRTRTCPSVPLPAKNRTRPASAVRDLCPTAWALNHGKVLTVIYSFQELRCITRLQKISIVWLCTKPQQFTFYVKTLFLIYPIFILDFQYGLYPWGFQMEICKQFLFLLRVFHVPHNS